MMHKYHNSINQKLFRKMMVPHSTTTSRHLLSKTLAETRFRKLSTMYYNDVELIAAYKKDLPGAAASPYVRGGCYESLEDQSVTGYREYISSHSLLLHREQLRLWRKS